MPISFSLGQNLQLIDSIQHHLKRAEGKEKYELLNSLAWEYRLAYPDSTTYFSGQAYRLGKKIGLTSDLGRSLNYMGIGHHYRGEVFIAYDFYNKALQVCSAQHDSLQLAHANNNIGRLCYEQGLLSRSYEYYIKARYIFHSINDSSGLAYVYQSLGNLYKTQRDYRKSEDNFLKAYEIRKGLKSKRDVLSAMIYLGRLYQESDALEKSITYFQRADSVGNLINDRISLAEIKTYLAESYLRKGLLNEAEAMSREALTVLLRLNNVRMMTQAYRIRGQIFFKRNDLGNAKKCFLQSLTIAKQLNDLNRQMKAHYDLWQLSEKQHNELESLRYHNNYLILKDSIKDLDLARQVERLQFENEIQRKERENLANHARDEAIIKQQRLQNLILVVIIAFVSILGFLQWRNSKKRREINEKLSLQNEEIEKQRNEIVLQNEKLSKRNHQLFELNHEKDTLMSIVAHDLKSPLHRIKGIVDLIEMEGGNAEYHKTYLKMVREGTQAGLDLIAGLLDVNMLEENVVPNYKTFDISKFLLEKVEAFTPAAEAKHIHLHISKVSSDEVNSDLDYLSRIMDNLISNAIKFSKQDATVTIAAGASTTEFWISVKDEGQGFSEKDKQQMFQKFKRLSARPTAGESSNGLGLAIVKTLVDRLKGTIELISESGKGSQFIMRIPTKNN
jgi:signal transduction histidine kinase